MAKIEVRVGQDISMKDSAAPRAERKPGFCDGTGPHGPHGGGRGQGRGVCDGNGPHGPRGAGRNRIA